MKELKSSFSLAKAKLKSVFSLHGGNLSLFIARINNTDMQLLSINMNIFMNNAPLGATHDTLYALELKIKNAGIYLLTVSINVYFHHINSSLQIV